MWNLEHLYICTFDICTSDICTDHKHSRLTATATFPKNASSCVSFPSSVDATYSPANRAVQPYSWQTMLLDCREERNGKEVTGPPHLIHWNASVNQEECSLLMVFHRALWGKHCPSCRSPWKVETPCTAESQIVSRKSFADITAETRRILALTCVL